MPGPLGQKKKYVRFRLHLQKNRVGWSLLNFYFFSEILFIIFPDFNKKHNRCVVCSKYIMKRGLFGPGTYVLMKSNATKVAKPITNGRKYGMLRVIDFFWNAN